MSAISFPSSENKHITYNYDTSFHSKEEANSNLLFKSYVAGVTWSSDGTEIAAYENYGGKVLVWNYPTGSILEQYSRTNFDSGRTSLSFYGESKQLIITPPINSSVKPSITVLQGGLGVGTRDIPGPFPTLGWRDNRAEEFSSLPAYPLLAMRFSQHAPVQLGVYENNNWNFLPIKDTSSGLDQGYPLSLNFTSDGSLLGVGRTNGIVSLYSNPGFQLERELEYRKLPGSRAIYKISFAQKKGLLAFATECGDQEQIVISNLEGNVLAVINEVDRPISQIDWGPGDFSILYTDGKGDLRGSAIAPGGSVSSSERILAGVVSFAFSPDRKRLAVSLSNRVDVYVAKQ
jgi:WD40 repeat protein